LLIILLILPIFEQVGIKVSSKLAIFLRKSRDFLRKNRDFLRKNRDFLRKNRFLRKDRVFKKNW